MLNLSVSASLCKLNVLVEYSQSHWFYWVLTLGPVGAPLCVIGNSLGFLFQQAVPLCISSFALEITQFTKKGGRGENSTKFPLETFLSMCYFYTNSEFILFFLRSSNILLQIHKAISSFTFCRIKCTWAESDEQEIYINFPATTSPQPLSFTGRDHKHAMNRLYVLRALPPSAIISKPSPQTPCLPSDELAK